MSALLDLTCGCEACGTRWETTAWEPKRPDPRWENITLEPDRLNGDWNPIEPCCPECASDTYTIIISVNNDFEPAARHESLTAEERNR